MNGVLRGIHWLCMYGSECTHNGDVLNSEVEVRHAPQFVRNTIRRWQSVTLESTKYDICVLLLYLRSIIHYLNILRPKRYSDNVKIQPHIDTHETPYTKYVPGPIVPGAMQ